MSTFLAYPDGRLLIGPTLEAGAEEARRRTTVTTWKELDIAGRFIATTVLDEIRSSDCVAADITYLNFNVTYELGYAIGLGKSILLLRNGAVERSVADISALGIFDTIGYETYQNSSEVAQILRGADAVRPLLSGTRDPNWKAPVYLLEAKYKTDYATRLISRINKAKLTFRSHEPNEQARLSASEAIRNVSESYGVIIPLITKDVADAVFHNLRCAFVAGLSQGMSKVHLILQQGEEPVPLDYRDLVRVVNALDQIDGIVGEFATLVTEAWQTGAEPPIPEPRTFLARLSLGASAAENELQDLSHYYLETDAFRKARRGEVHLVVGRKGSGKTAIFVRLREQIVKDKRRLVLDLKPEGYRLLKFKEEVLTSLRSGTVEHTITAIWEYVLLLEVAHKLLEKDRQTHVFDRDSYEAYHRLAALYRPAGYDVEGDFSERLAWLLATIAAKRLTAPIDGRLSDADVTKLVYVHDVPALRKELHNYLRRKTEVWILFDNVDRGWPTRGLEYEDLVIVRALIEAMRKVERHLRQDNVSCYPILFIRNDVYELLVEETSDRGKESKVLLDWTDADLLRELVRRRLVFNGASESATFDEVWRSIAVSHINGEESFQFLVDRCLMRPRCLIDLINYARSTAVNLQHERMTVHDFEKGVDLFSTDVVTDVGLEMRDINPAAENALYALIGERASMTESELRKLLVTAGLSEQLSEAVFELLLWYGVIGVQRPDGQVAFIYSVNYDMNLLKGIARKLGNSAMYHVHIAFWPALGVRA